MFLDTFQDTNPTRYRQGVNPHVFDLMLTDEERMADQLRGKSDHIYIYTHTHTHIYIYIYVLLLY